MTTSKNQSVESKSNGSSFVRDYTIQAFKDNLYSRLREVKVAKFHQQHQTLIEILTELYGQIQYLQQHRPTPEKEQALANVLDKLKQYAAKHFQEEEKFMAKMNFPGLKNHILAHRKFVATLTALEKQIWQESITYVVDLLQLVVTWLFEHINHMDMQYSRASQGEVVSQADLQWSQRQKKSKPNKPTKTPPLSGAAFRQYLQNMLPDVGVGQFNQEHRKLLDAILDIHLLATSLSNRLPCQEDWEKFHALLDFLAQYVKQHFAAEEKWMRRTNYPSMASHIQEHQQAAKRLLKIQENLQKKQDIAYIVDLNFYFCHWFMTHTARTDVEYRDFFKGKQVA